MAARGGRWEVGTGEDGEGGWPVDLWVVVGTYI